MARGRHTWEEAGLVQVKDIEMVTDTVRTGAGTPLCEGTRERKESEMTEQGLLPSQGGEGVQGQRSRKEP